MFIDILMATYNGEKYIENQILSLFQQTHKEWKLYIHDDGSTDNTLNIIKKYMELDRRIFLIEDNITGLKVGKNFLHTLSFSQENYAIFCDQDDIWLEDKLEELLKIMTKNDKLDKPVLVYCDGYAWDENSVIHPESISTNHAEDLQDFIMFNGGYQGCSIMMNKKLVDIAKSYNGYIYHHDDLVSLIAHSLGEVYFLPKKLMLYRQHSGAVTGNKDFKKKGFNKLFKNSEYLISRNHYEFKQDFYRIFKDNFDVEKDLVFKYYFEFCSIKSKIMRVLFIMPKNITYGGNKTKLIFKIILQRLFNI